MKNSPPNLAPAHRLASQFQASQQPQFPTESQLQSHLQPPQEIQQSQPVCRWSAYAPPFGESPSPFILDCPTLSTNATVAGELFLFGGYVHRLDAPTNKLYVISTRDFSTTFLQTSGDIPSPRYGHRAVLTNTTLLIFGGTDNMDAQNLFDGDSSLYLLNLASREWTRMVVNGHGPSSRHLHTMMMVGSKLFVFGGKSRERRFNDIWALDLNSLKSNPFWESYEPASGNEKPLPRSAHISVNTGDRIIIFGGYDGTSSFNDAWSFNISTRKWTELQCTGSIPLPRATHAAVLVGDVMYVFGGLATDGAILGDLTALNLSTQRWTAFQDIGPSLSGRSGHAMACDGTHLFVLGGFISPGVQVDEAKFIYALDTQRLVYPEPDSDAVNHPTSQQITRERSCNLSDLPSRSTGASGRPRRVPEEGEGSNEHHAKFVVPDAPSGKEMARLEHAGPIGLGRQLSETPVAKAERDRRIGQLTDELALKSALLAQAAEEKRRAGQELRKLQTKLDEALLSHNHALEQAEANAAKEKRRAELEQRELQAKFDGLLLSRDQAEANAEEEKRRGVLEQRELQAKLDELVLSRDEHLRTLEQAPSALHKATSRAADADERSQPACAHGTELAEVRTELEGKKSELAAVLLRLADAEDGWAKSKAETDTLRTGTQATAGLVNTDVDRVMRRLLERVRAVEAEMVSLRGNEKSIEDMECRNEE